MTKVGFIVNEKKTKFMRSGRDIKNAKQDLKYLGVQIGKLTRENLRSKRKYR